MGGGTSSLNKLLMDNSNENHSMQSGGSFIEMVDGKSDAENNFNNLSQYSEGSVNNFQEFLEKQNSEKGNLSDDKISPRDMSNYNRKSIEKENVNIEKLNSSNKRHQSDNLENLLEKHHAQIDDEDSEEVERLSVGQDSNENEDQSFDINGSIDGADQENLNKSLEQSL